MKHDLLIPGTVALVLHGLLLSLPLAGKTKQVFPSSRYPICISILHPERSVVPKLSIVTSSIQPVIAPDELHRTTKEQGSRDEIAADRQTMARKGSSVDKPVKNGKIEEEAAAHESAQRLPTGQLRSEEKPPPVRGVEEDPGYAFMRQAAPGVSDNEDFFDSGEKGFAAPQADQRAQDGIVYARPEYAANPPPDYPRVARRRGYEGLTLLRVEVLESGKVGRVEIADSSGFLVLDRAALKSVKHWQFVPGTIDGEKTGQWVMVPVEFSLK